MKLDVELLTKHYKGGFTVGPINFSLSSGEILAIIGANGAGKSTLYQMLTGNMDATSGQVLIDGEKMLPERVHLKRRIGYLPQDLALPKWVSPLDIMNYGASLYGNISEKQIKEKLDYFACNTYLNKPLQTCSHGMQKRAGLALATIHEPDLLILDEPFSGLDIIQTKALTHSITNRKIENKSTILSTHIPSYIAKICDRCIVIKDGKTYELTNFHNNDFLTRIELIEKQFFD